VPNIITAAAAPGQEYRTNLQLICSREGGVQIERVVPSDAAIRTEVSRPIPNDDHRYTIGVVLPKDFRSASTRPASIEIHTDQKDLPNRGIVTVPIRVWPRSTQPAVQASSGP